MTNGLKIIGDVHGRVKTYAKLCHKAEKEGLCTIQIGDMNFSYGHFEHWDLKSDKHIFIGGNHDNYDIVDGCANYLGDFGVKTHGGVEFFFVRGAFSIDQAVRREGVSWWRREELSMSECYEALSAYEEAKPRIVITHECPTAVSEMLGKKLGFRPIPTRTDQLLQQMWEIHKPERWYFGHYHLDWTKLVQGTHFQCIKGEGKDGSMSYVDI